MWVRTITNGGSISFFTVDATPTAVAVAGSCGIADFIVDGIELATDSAMNGIAFTMDLNGQFTNGITGSFEQYTSFESVALDSNNDIYVGAEFLMKTTTRIVSVSEYEPPSNIQFALHNNTVTIMSPNTTLSPCTLGVYSLTGELLCTLPTVTNSDQSMRAELPGNISSSALLLLMRCGDDVIGRGVVVR